MNSHLPIDSVERLARAVSEMRKNTGLTQEALATKAGVSRKFVVEVEKGHPRAELEKVLQLFRALELSPVVLASKDGEGFTSLDTEQQTGRSRAHDQLTGGTPSVPEPLITRPFINSAERLAAIVMAAREARDLTQEELATTAGVSLDFLDDIENGIERAEISQTIRVLNQLGIEPRAMPIRPAWTFGSDGRVKSEYLGGNNERTREFSHEAYRDAGASGELLGRLDALTETTTAPFGRPSTH